MCPVHMVREIDVGSPAEVADIKDGNILLEVNGESVDYLSHEKVVSKIRDSGEQVSFTTITHEGQDFYKKVRKFDRSEIYHNIRILFLIQ